MMLDFYNLKEWATNINSNLDTQDEELFLADELFLEIILQVLDTVPIIDEKRDILLEALCIIVYDNSTNDNQKRNESLRLNVLAELNKRKDLLVLADKNISDYIKAVVYPQLDITIK